MCPNPHPSPPHTPVASTLHTRPTDLEGAGTLDNAALGPHLSTKGAKSVAEQGFLDLKVGLDPSDRAWVRIVELPRHAGVSVSSVLLL